MTTQPKSWPAWPVWSTGSASSRRSSATTCAASPTATTAGREDLRERLGPPDDATVGQHAPNLLAERHHVAGLPRLAGLRGTVHEAPLTAASRHRLAPPVIWTTRPVGRKAGGGGAARGLPPARTLLASAGTPTGTTPAAAARIVRKGAGQMGCTTTCCPPGARGRPDSQARNGGSIPRTRSAQRPT